MADQITKADVVKFIEGMTVLELSELVKELEEKFGVSAAAPVAVAAAGAPAAAAAPAEEKTEFDAILTGFGNEKIQVIKAVREITNLGLKEAKELVEALPAVVGEDLPKEEANALKEKLEAQGAKVQLS